MRRTTKQDPPYQSDVFSRVPRAALVAVGKRPTARLVLFALGTFRHTAETVCYPSIATLCEITGLGERTVRTALQHLVASGALVVVRPHSQHMPTSYRIQTGNLCGSDATGEQAPDRQSVHARPAAPAPEVTTEDTTTTTATNSQTSTARAAVAVQDCIAIGSSFSGRPSATDLRSANQRSRNGLTLLRVDMAGVFERMIEKAGAA